ncbi:DciA family protein [Thermosulfuriphilus sp.]
MDTIGGILSGLWSSQGWQQRLASRRIWEVWEEAVGREVARRARPESFVRGRLTVVVENSAWMHQLQLQSLRIKKALAKALKEELVKEIRFRLGPVEKRATPRRPPIVIPLEVRETLTKAVASIEDTELREAFLRLRLKDWQVKVAQSRKSPSAWEV